VDGDGGPGDGEIDMSDFRRWRDWYLQAEEVGGLSLDGDANHPKKDLNRDGSFDAGPQENVYPIGDFNGDGTINFVAKSFVPGLVNAEISDLDLLKQLFVDPDVEPDQLDALIESGDVTVDASEAYASNQTASTAVVTIEELGIEGVNESRTHLTGTDSEVRIYTVPSSTYRLRIRMLDGGGAELAADSTDVLVFPGSDELWKPVAEPAAYDPDPIPPSSFKIENPRYSMYLAGVTPSGDCVGDGPLQGELPVQWDRVASCTFPEGQVTVTLQSDVEGPTGLARAEVSGQFQTSTSGSAGVITGFQGKSMVWVRVDAAGVPKRTSSGMTALVRLRTEGSVPTYAAVGCPTGAPSVRAELDAYAQTSEVTDVATSGCAPGSAAATFSRDDVLEALVPFEYGVPTRIELQMYPRIYLSGPGMTGPVSAYAQADYEILGFDNLPSGATVTYSDGSVWVSP
jgi:hypothetical protein